MTDLFGEPDDATPLDPALRDYLLQSWITTRNDTPTRPPSKRTSSGAGDLGAPPSSRYAVADILTDDYVKTLHKQMFGEVWKWAGTYRQNELNIGVAPHRVAAEMPTALSNVQFWVDNKTFEAAKEIAKSLHLPG